MFKIFLKILGTGRAATAGLPSSALGEFSIPTSGPSGLSPQVVGGRQLAASRPRRWTAKSCLPVALALLTLFFATPPRQCRGDDGWADTKVSGPFICRADFALGSVDALLANLAQLQNDLIQRLGVPPAEEPIELYLFHDQRAYKRYLKQHLSDIPYRRALYLKKDGPGIVLAYVSPQLAVDLRHECTHALLHSSLSMVPLWLDEGLAEYFEIEPSKRADANPYSSTVRWNARFGILPKLEKLESKDSVGSMKGSDYRNAWAWIHFILHGSPQAHEELVAFLRDISVSTPPGVFSQRLRQRLPDVERKLAAHFRGLKR
jgi:hypothetical protein